MRVGGKSVSAISNTLRLLKLPPDVKHAVAQGELSEGQARPLIGTDESTVLALLPTIIREHWSARKIEDHIASLRVTDTKKPRPSNSARPQEYVSLMKRFDTRVTMQQNTKGVGRIVIEFKSEDERQRIEKQLGA